MSDSLSSASPLLEADPRRQTYLNVGLWGRARLDQLFRRNVARAPDDIVLRDPLDKADWYGDISYNLTGSEADARVTRLAMRFTELGLKPGNVVAVQMPNLVELPLTLLACFRAGLVPALIPLLWREKDMIAALHSLQPRALISVTQAGPLKPADHMRYVAATLLSVRYILSFGPDTPDGVLTLNDVLENNLPIQDSKTALMQSADDAAFITFRPTLEGHAPVVRSHNHAVCAGLAPMLESQMESGAETLCTTIQQTSLGGLATGFLPWLLSGGCLVLHQPYNRDLLLEQIETQRVTRLALPGPVLHDFIANLEGDKSISLKSVFALYSDARRMHAREALLVGVAVIDCAAFDEYAMLTRMRHEGVPLPFQIGLQFAPHGSKSAPFYAEMSLSKTQHIQFRGPSVPHNGTNEDGYSVTGYRAHQESNELIIEGRDDGVAFVGGLSAGIDDIAAHILNMDGVETVSITALPDPVFGEQLQARIAFQPGLQSLERNIERIRKECAGIHIAPHKIPGRFVVDDNSLEQQLEDEKRAG